MEGKVCKTCKEWKVYDDYYKHKKMKDGHMNECKICMQEYQVKYRQKKKLEGGKVCDKCGVWKKLDEFTKNKKAKDGRVNSCKECMNKYSKEYRKDKPDAVKEWNKRYYKDNKEYYKEYSKKYNEENIEFVKEIQKLYNQSEKGRDSLYRRSIKRRSYEHNVKFTSHERKEILERDNWKCQHCGIDVHDESTGDWNTPNKAHIDHIIPISKGGTSEPDNLQVLCRTCNLSKKDKIVI